MIGSLHLLIHHLKGEIELSYESRLITQLSSTNLKGESAWTGDGEEGLKVLGEVEEDGKERC